MRLTLPGEEYGYLMSGFRTREPSTHGKQNMLRLGPAGGVPSRFRDPRIIFWREVYDDLIADFLEEDEEQPS